MNADEPGPDAPDADTGSEPLRSARRQKRHEPMFNLPGVVLWLAVAFLAVHIVRLSLPEAQDDRLTIALAFIPARYSGYADQIPGGALASVTAFLTHAFVHGDWTHLAINSVWLAAFGGAVARRMSAPRFLAFFAFCAVAGALAFLAVNPGSPVPMVGASGAISGLMGATMRYLFRGMEHGGFHVLSERPRDIPLLPVGEALRDRRVLSTTGFWLVVNLLAVLGLGGLGSATGQIAWEAHIGGYLAGLLAFGLFDPVGVVATRDLPPPPQPRHGPDRADPVG